MTNFRPALAAVLLAATLLPSGARAAAEAPLQAGDTVYYCDRGGNFFWSRQPCEEIGATLVRRAVLAEPPPGTAPGTFEMHNPDAPPPPIPPERKPVYATDDASAPASAPAAATEAAAPAAVPAPAKDDVLKQGQRSLLRLLAFGLVVGLLGKWRERSFVFWFFLGCVLEVVLVALNVLPG